MGGRGRRSPRPTGALTTFLLVILAPLASGLNLGLIAGDLRRHTSPLIIKKVTRHAPVFINIAPGLSKPAPPLSLPKLPPKPPPLKLSEQKPSKKVARSLPPSLSPPRLPPLLPILPPLLPILPPILPPLLPGLPLLPILPILLPKIKKPLGPLRVPILKRSIIKPAESKLRVGSTPPLKVDQRGILRKLRDLKKRGSLTAAEYIRFKKLLLS